MAGWPDSAPVYQHMFRVVVGSFSRNLTSLPAKWSWLHISDSCWKMSQPHNGSVAQRKNRCISLQFDRKCKLFSCRFVVISSAQYASCVEYSYGVRLPPHLNAIFRRLAKRLSNGLFFALPVCTWFCFGYELFGQKLLPTNKTSLAFLLRCISIEMVVLCLLWPMRRRRWWRWQLQWHCI